MPVNFSSNFGTSTAIKLHSKMFDFEYIYKTFRFVQLAQKLLYFVINVLQYYSRKYQEFKRIITQHIKISNQ